MSAASIATSTTPVTPNTMSTPTLQGQTVLVIGGTSGIGFGVAEAALHPSAGAAKVIVASSSPDKVARAVERLRTIVASHESAGSATSNRVEGFILDAKDLSSLSQKLSLETLGPINHLVFTSGDNIAGVVGTNISQVDVPGMKELEIFDVRFWAAVEAAKCVSFVPDGPKSVTFTSGVNSFKPALGWTIAAGVGSALVGLTRGLAVDFAPQGVRVNCIAPGWVWTEIFDSVPEDRKEAMKARGSSSNLLHRVGNAEDLAQAYLFVMKCGFITGQTLHVDGGQLLL